MDTLNKKESSYILSPMVCVITVNKYTMLIEIQTIEGGQKDVSSLEGTKP